MTFVDETNIEEFKKLYNEAVEKGKVSFDFHRTEVLVSYGKYVIEHADEQFPKGGSNAKKD